MALRLRALLLSFLILTGLGGLVVTAGPAAASSPAFCPSGWQFYVHAPYVNAFGSNEIDAWATCVPASTPANWPDIKLNVGCGIDTIESWSLYGYPLKSWQRVGINYMNGGTLGGWGNTTNAGAAPFYYSYSGSYPGNYWITYVLTWCAGTWEWKNTDSVQRWS